MIQILGYEDYRIMEGYSYKTDRVIPPYLIIPFKKDMFIPDSSLFKYSSKCPKPGSKIYTQCKAISDFTLKGIYTITPNIQDADIIVYEEFNMVERIKLRLLIHDISKTVIVTDARIPVKNIKYSLMPDIYADFGVNSQSFKRIEEIDALKINFPHEGLLDIVKNADRCPIYSPDFILKHVETSATDFTVELCDGIFELLKSKDPSVRQLGIQTLFSLNVYKFRETTCFLLNMAHLTDGQLYPSDIKGIIVRNYTSTLSMRNAFSKVISKEDFDILISLIYKKYNVKSINGIYNRFVFPFMSKSLISNEIKINYA